MLTAESRLLESTGIAALDLLILKILEYEGPQGVSELAAACFRSPMSIYRALTRLESRQLIRKTPDPFCKYHRSMRVELVPP
ncbi:MAG: MarR family transcriptional regulator [Candidatus Thorarchaeota archaeon]